MVKVRQTVDNDTIMVRSNTMPKNIPQVGREGQQFLVFTEKEGKPLILGTSNERFPMNYQR